MRAAGVPQRRRAAPLLLGGDAAVPARCKLGSASAQGLFDDSTIGANASTPYHVKLTRAVLVMAFNSVKARPRRLSLYSFAGAGSRYGQRSTEIYFRGGKGARSGDTPRHMGIFQPSGALVVAGGSGI